MCAKFDYGPILNGTFEITGIPIQRLTKMTAIKEYFVHLAMMSPAVCINACHVKIEEKFTTYSTSVP